MTDGKPEDAVPVVTFVGTGSYRASVVCPFCGGMGDVPNAADSDESNRVFKCSGRACHGMALLSAEYVRWSKTILPNYSIPLLAIYALVLRDPTNTGDVSDDDTYDYTDVAEHKGWTPTKFVLPAPVWNARDAITAATTATGLQVAGFIANDKSIHYVFSTTCFCKQCLRAEADWLLKKRATRRSTRLVTGKISAPPVSTYFVRKSGVPSMTTVDTSTRAADAVVQTAD